MEKNIKLTPILKWVGGKKQLLSEITPLIPKKITTYVEPFIGGGAVLFNLQPKKAIINDLNKELINTYKVVKESPRELLELLKIHDKNNCEDYFYEIRALDRTNNFENINNIEKAARVIYLNKTCFNGLYRVNKAGLFNSPYGKYKNPNIINESAILAMSDYFNNNNIKIIQGDYKNALKGLKKNTFVYFDPPYMPISTSSSFTNYTKTSFNEKEQIELKKECDKLDNKGIKFMLSNSDHPLIRELYKDFDIKIVKAKRSINSKGNSRGKINEILVKNYDIL